jgi:hypothetical protein
MIVPRCTIVLVQKLAIHKLFHIKQKKEKKKKKKKKKKINQLIFKKYLNIDKKK